MQFGLDGSTQTIPQSLGEDQRIEDDAGRIFSPHLVELIEIGLGGYVRPGLGVSEDGSTVVLHKLLPVLVDEFCRGNYTGKRFERRYK